MSNTGKYGKLIGASLGSGDPELITRRSWAVLQSGARWLYPVIRAAEKSYALSIVERGGLAVPDDAVELVFPMTRDAEALGKAWVRAAKQTVDLLAEGRDLAFLVEGDASTFATFAHLVRVVRELVPEIEVETIPGVSSFTAAATTGISLAEEDETLAIIPTAYGIGVIDHMFDEFDTLILLKVKPLLDDVVELLERRGLLATSCFIEKVGSPDERVIRDVGSLKGEKVNYLSLLLVQNPKRQRGELRRGCRRRKEAEAAAAGASKCYAGSTDEQVGALFADYDGIVAVFSLGAMVRLCAPYLKSKDVDPAVVVLDEGSRFAIPMLSGHLGGANALAGRIAAALGATAVLTTASDSQETIGVDLLGRELGWTLEATHEALVRVSAAVVNEDPVALVQEAGSRDWWVNHANGRNGPLPANIRRFARLEDVDPGAFAAYRPGEGQ